MAVNLTKGILDYTFTMGIGSEFRKVDVSTLVGGDVIVTGYVREAYQGVMGAVRVTRFPGLHADTVAEILRSVDGDHIMEEIIWED
jgi:hypothetical protein